MIADLFPVHPISLWAQYLPTAASLFYESMHRFQKAIQYNHQPKLYCTALQDKKGFSLGLLSEVLQNF